MNSIIYSYTVMDELLMYLYRFPDNPLIGYFLGTFFLSFACVLIGEYSISFAFRINREKINHNNHEIEYYQNLSIEALKTGDRAAYKACNSIANHAYGKNFFSQITLSASSLWPVFIALGWMQYRFSEVEFSLPFSLSGISITVGYLITFILCYISTRIIFTNIRNKYQYFRTIKKGLIRESCGRLCIFRHSRILLSGNPEIR